MNPEKSPPNPETVSLIQEFRRRAKLAPWLAYPVNCVPAVRPWHESKADYRVLSGPNRGGKTTGAAFEIVSYAMGYNPIRDEHYETPNVCWAVCLDYQGGGGRAMLRKIIDMLPRLQNGRPDWTYNKQEHLITIQSTGSEIYIKSQKEGQSSLVGEGCTAIWIDEAMGGETGLENFNELKMRRIPGEDLQMLFTLTPLMHTGIDWMRRMLWQEPGTEPHEEFLTGTFCHRFEIEDCLKENGGFWTRQEVEKMKENMPEEEKEARLRGIWTPFMTRAAFSYKYLMKTMERAPRSRPGRFTTGLIRPRWEESDDGPGRMQRERESQHSYIVAWDPSSGLGKGHDPSSLVVFDRADLTLVYHARSSDLGPEEFARQIALPAARYFNEAILAIEGNGEGGGAAIGACRDIYDNLYVQKNYSKTTATWTDKLGWTTTEQSRGRMIDALARTLKEDKWTPCKDLLEEMSHMVVKQVGSRTRVEHADGYHDDLPMAAGIALAIHYEEPVYEWPDFNKLRIRYGPSYTTQNLAIS